MRLLVLRNGKCAFVDPEDFDYVNQWKWSCNSSGYAWRREGSTAKPIYLHKVINKTPDDLFTDHINRNRLDNRRSNLRSVTWSENRINTGMFSNNTSGYKGVYWESATKKWIAAIGTGTKLKKLGRFASKEDAVNARQTAEKELHSIATRT